MRSLQTLLVILASIPCAACGAATPKSPGYPAETRLVGEIARRLPRPWFLSEVTSGRVKLTNGMESDGLHLVLWELPKTYDEYKAGTGDRIHLYWMAAGYSLGKPDSQSTTEAIPWNGRLLIVPSIAPARWPDFRTDLFSALKAAQSDPEFAAEGSNVFVGRVQFERIHVNTRDMAGHGFHLQGTITDRLTGRKQSFYLRPWSHTGSKLEGGNGKEYIIVGGQGNNDWGFTAVVPLGAVLGLFD